MAELQLATYPNSPVMEVAWEIRFPSQPVIDSKMSELKSEYEPKFPHVQKLEDRSWTFNLSKVEGISRLEGNVWEFADSVKRNKIIRINNQRFAVITKVHKNLNDLMSFVKDVLESFTSIINGDQNFTINRLGLRYINECKFPGKDPNRFSEWYIMPFNESLFKIDENAFFDFILAESINSVSTKTRYRRVTFDEDPGFILDFDCYKKEEIVFSDLLMETKKLGKIIHNKFSESITQLYEETEMRRKIT